MPLDPHGAHRVPAEMADLVVFLESERASYLTGTSVTTYGRMTKSMA